MNIAFQSRPLLGVFFCLQLMLAGCAVQAPVVSDKEAGYQAAIASAHPLATEAGEKILREGGNAFDAAVAISAALAVVEPYGSGLGGGGFWLLHEEISGRDVMIDGREKAPLAATRNMYLDDDGEVIPGLSVNGALAAGIPGTPAALVHLAERYGELPLSQLLAPAIELAEQGFPADRVYRQLGAFRLPVLQASLSASEIFLRDGQLPKEGELVRQPALAQTLRAIVQRGRDGFYAGEVGTRLVEGVTAAGGIWSHDDLKSYEVVERKPVRFDYEGMTVTTAQLPSSGGIVMAEIFNQLEGTGYDATGEASRIHRLAEAMRRAYRDRAQYLGDMDFVDVPVERLLSKDYAAGLRQSTRDDKATRSGALAPTYFEAPLGNNTTHFSVMDAEGNRVAATMSINYPFGSGFVPPGTGVLLNDEMDDFSAKPGTPNVYGLVGAEANAIAPGKRMLSSMSPSFLETADRLAVIGTPGGSRIITMVTLGALAFKNGEPVESIVSLPRVHHQYLPDRIEYEKGALSSEVIQSLEQRGHRLEENNGTWGNMQAVVFDKKTRRASAASDPRGIGDAQVLTAE
ncbi:MAG: gamma-glutamyltransferase [bacterium]